MTQEGNSERGRSRSRAAERERAIARYLALQPRIKARMEASVPEELRTEFASVTAHQLRALVALPENGLSMRHLSEAMNVMGATASVLADRLVVHGLVVREHDPADRRVVRLVPTERGTALARRYQQAQRAAAETLFDRLTDEQVEAWLDVLETLAADGDDPADARPSPTRQAAASSGTALVPRVMGGVR